MCNVTSNLIIYNKEYLSTLMTKATIGQAILLNNIMLLIHSPDESSEIKGQHIDHKQLFVKYSIMMHNRNSEMQEQRRQHHNRIYQWIHSHSQQKIKEIFTISHPENVKQILDSLDRIAAFRQNPIYSSQTMRRNLKKKQNSYRIKEIFNKIKIACISKPFLYIDPTYALNWLVKMYGKNCLYHNQDDSILQGGLNCIWQTNGQYHCALEKFISESLKKQLWEKFTSKNVGKRLQLLKKINQFANNRFKNRSNSFGVSIGDVLRKANMEQCLIDGEQLQNDYYDNLQEISLQLLEQQEKNIANEQKKKNKKQKKKYTKSTKKTDQQTTKKVYPTNPFLPKTSSIINNPEVRQLFDTKVEKPIDKKRQHQKLSFQAGEQKMEQIQFETPFILENSMNNQIDDIRSSRSTCTNNSQGQKSSNFNQHKIKYVEKNVKIPQTSKIVVETVQKSVNHMLFGKILAISQKNQELWALKNIAYGKLNDYLRDFHPQFQSRIYGSFAAGSSLPHSDLDVLLTPYSHMVISHDFLVDMAEHIQVENWVSCCKPILTAKFPVIKLIIDPYANVDGLPSGFKYQSYQDQLKKPFLIKVDLSLNRHGAANTGLIATELLRNVYGQSPIIKDTIILLKSILDSRQLNEGYKGGISSFCLFTMLICYIQHKQVNLNCNLIDLVCGFITFISKDFDPNTMVFRYRSNDKCIISFEQYLSIPENISLKKSGKLKIIDPTTNKLIQASFSKYDQVIETLRKILDFIETLEIQMQNIYESVKIKHKKHFFNAIPLIEKNIQESSIFGLLQDFLFLE